MVAQIPLKVTFARNLAKKLSPLFYYLILLFQLSVANPETFEELKAQEVLKIRKEKTGVSPTTLCTLYENSISLSAYSYGIFKV